jgi:WD40 repeat protein
MYSSEIISVAFSPDGRQALSGGADGTIELWELPTGKLVHRLKHSEDTGFYVLYVAFSADGRQGLSDANGRQVLSSHYWHDPVVKLWDAASGKLVRSFEGTSTTGKVAVSPDGRQVLSGGINGTMELWDSASGELVRTFAGHDHAVTSVTFSPDSKQVLSGSWDKTVKLWDAASGKLVRSFERHSDIVRSVAFSPQGKQVLSGSESTIRLWNTETGDLLASLIASPEGEWLAMTPAGVFCCLGWQTQHARGGAGARGL